MNRNETWHEPFQDRCNSPIEISEARTGAKPMTLDRIAVSAVTDTTTIGKPHATESTMTDRLVAAIV